MNDDCCMVVYSAERRASVRHIVQ